MCTFCCEHVSHTYIARPSCLECVAKLLAILYCRSKFKGSTLLQDVRSYIQQNRPELRNQDYSLVSLHLGREFSANDLQSSLADLGVQSQTSLRLRNKEAQLGEPLTSARPLLLTLL